MVRFYFLHMEGARNERLWYVKKLHYEFSTEIDSLLVLPKDRGWIYFHITDGEVNKAVERNLNRRLKYNGNLRFVVDRGTTLAILTSDAGKYALGDSLRITADRDLIEVYRNKILVSHSEITKSLMGSPF